MAKLVATCVDEPPPADGDAFAACTSVEWVSVASWEVPDLTYAQWGEVLSAALLFFVAIFSVRAIRKHAL